MIIEKVIILTNWLLFDHRKRVISSVFECYVWKALYCRQ